MSSDCCPPSASDGKPRTRKASSGGYNWSAIGILIMFAVPMIMMGIIHITEMIWPVDQSQVIARKQLVNCYTIADPSKLSNIDSLLNKYKGKEHKLLGKLGEKYPKTPECSLN